jgi:hypothetical protein
MATTIKTERKDCRQINSDTWEEEFDRDLKRAISGDELLTRISGRIHKMFEDEGNISVRSRALPV